MRIGRRFVPTLPITAAQIEAGDWQFVRR